MLPFLVRLYLSFQAYIFDLNLRFYQLRCLLVSYFYILSQNGYIARTPCIVDRRLDIALACVYIRIYCTSGAVSSVKFAVSVDTLSLFLLIRYLFWSSLYWSMISVVLRLQSPYFSVSPDFRLPVLLSCKSECISPVSSSLLSAVGF